MGVYTQLTILAHMGPMGAYSGYNFHTFELYGSCYLYPLIFSAWVLAWEWVLAWNTMVLYIILQRIVAI